MPSPLYGATVALHVVLVVAGTAGLGVTLGYLAACRRAGANAAVTRFFARGPGLAPRLLYPAAALGLVAALGSDQRVRLQWAWVWGAGTLWLAAAMCIEGGLRPAERRLAGLVAGGHGKEPAGGHGGAPGGPDSGAVRAAAGLGLMAAGAALGLVLASSALMVAQP